MRKYTNIYGRLANIFAQKNPRKTLSVIFYDTINNSFFFGYSFYNDNKNLNGTIRSLLFTAQPVESKNEQNTRNKLKLEKQNPN